MPYLLLAWWLVLTSITSSELHRQDRCFLVVEDNSLRFQWFQILNISKRSLILSVSNLNYKILQPLELAVLEKSSLAQPKFQTYFEILLSLFFRKLLWNPFGHVKSESLSGLWRKSASIKAAAKRLPILMNHASTIQGHQYFTRVKKVRH